MDKEINKTLLAYVRMRTCAYAASRHDPCEIRVGNNESDSLMSYKLERQILLETGFTLRFFSTCTLRTVLILRNNANVNDVIVF